MRGYVLVWGLFLIVVSCSVSLSFCLSVCLSLPGMPWQPWRPFVNSRVTGGLRLTKVGEEAIVTLPLWIRLFLAVFYLCHGISGEKITR